MFYVIELQTGNEGAGIVTAFPNKADALARAYTVAAAAVKSAVPLHTVMVISGSGFDVIEPMVFEHEAQAEPAKSTKSSK